MTPKEYNEKLAAALATVDYREDVAGQDKRGILFGLKRAERDCIVRALRSQFEERKENL